MLMAARMLIVLAAGAALAKPVIKPTRQGIARVFLVDVSRSVANRAQAADSVKRFYYAGDAVIVLDSSARLLGASAVESLSTIRAGINRGNLSAGLIASLRGASSIRDRADSLELVIVSPLVEGELDAATDTIRKLWPGRARLIRVAPSTDSATTAKSNVDVHAIGDDPLIVAVGLATKENTGASVRILRSATVSTDDSEWATSADHALVVWPITGRPPFTVAVTPPNVSGGIAGTNAKIVAAFNRSWKFPVDSLRSARVAARWADGEPAVVEKMKGEGCVRSVAIPVTPIGDLVLRSEFVALVREIASPCRPRIPTKTLSASQTSSLAGAGPLAPGNAFVALEGIPSPLTPWLLGIALFAAAAEFLLRRRRS
jgi:hypothetical protein